MGHETAQAGVIGRVVVEHVLVDHLERLGILEPVLGADLLGHLAHLTAENGNRAGPQTRRRTW